MFYTANTFLRVFLICFVNLLVYQAVAADFDFTHNKPLVIYSESVNDSFEIFISLPATFKNDGFAAVVFYFDANLKLGEQLRSKLDAKDGNAIFVGIGHIGNYRIKRRRDFIPPHIANSISIESNNPNYGHADELNRFIEKELIPYVNTNYPNNGEYSLIGHSFSGLFIYYAFFQDKALFKNYVSLSPSLWVNSSNVFEYEELCLESKEKQKYTRLKI